MNKDFSILELLKFAISIEEEGVKFYNDLADMNDNEDAKAFMRQLANDELQHAAVFQKIYDEVATEENVYEYLYDQDIDAVFSDYAKYAAFNRDVLEGSSLKEVIKVAIETEQITIDYYDTMKKYAKAKLLPILERLIEEETNHRNQLTEFLKKY